MIEPRAALSPEEEAELEQLCEEYATTTANVRKEIKVVGNPPDPVRVQTIFDAEAKATAILARIKNILVDDQG
jgi:hypothetical protein